MKTPVPLPLSMYRRDFSSDIEVGPRHPVFAVGLVSPKGIPFVLVREEIGADNVGHMLAWLIWREDVCVGYIGSTPPRANLFVGGVPLARRRALEQDNAVKIWRTHIADGCVFRSKPITRFGRSRSPISVEADHSFRSKPITHFGRSRSPISVEADHPFRSKPISQID